MAWMMLLIAMWATVMRTPRTPLARAVWRWTVDRPIAWAARTRRGDVLVVLMLATAASVVAWWIGREAVQLFAMAAPDIGVWLVTFEIGTYLDALTAVLVAASALRLRGIVARGRARRSRRSSTAPRPRPRARRARATPAPAPAPANDDDGDGRRRAA